MKTIRASWASLAEGQRLRATAIGAGTVAGALGLFDLTRRSFWTDEAYNLVLVRDPWTSFVRTIGDREPSQALYLIFLKPYVAVAGSGALLVRLPSVIATVVAAMLLVFLARRLFDRMVALLTGLFFATSGAVIEWSQYARTYSLAALAAVVTTALFVRAIDRDEVKAWLLYGCAAALSIYCHFYAGFVLVAHALAFTATGRRPFTRGPMIAVGVVAVGLIPFAAYLVAGTRSPVDWIPPLSGGQVIRALWFAAGANAALAAAAFAGTVVLARSPIQPRRATLALVLGWALAPLACGAIVSVAKPALVPRFMIVTTPAVALLAAVAVAALRAPWQRLLCAGTILAFAAVQLQHVYTKDPEDWRAAARVARTARGHGSTIAVAPEYAWRAFDVAAPDVPRTTMPTGRTLTLFVQAAPTDRSAVAAGFMGRAPYRLAATRKIGDGDIVAERWTRSRP
ncbi:MAG: glycosyltransferase family 39 protein [Gaiellaceae bacterium]